VTYGDLIAFNGCQILAVFVADAPRPVLALFDRAATDLVHALYEQYSAIHNEVFVRFTRLPVDDKIRDLRWVTGAGDAAGDGSRGAGRGVGAAAVCFR